MVNNAYHKLEFIHPAHILHDLELQAVEKALGIELYLRKRVLDDRPIEFNPEWTKTRVEDMLILSGGKARIQDDDGYTDSWALYISAINYEEQLKECRKYGDSYYVSTL